MIFVTVGTDQPFDRMIRIIDAWARENNRTDVFGQIGEGATPPSFISYSHFLEPPDFLKRFQAANLIVAHAGMGTILSALRFAKPILIFPRLASLGEQRNEHQLATAKRLLELGKVNVAFSDDELRSKLGNLDKLAPRGKITTFASTQLIDSLRNFIDQA